MAHIRGLNLSRLMTRRNPLTEFGRHGYIAGTVQVEGVPASRRVRCVERFTGRLIAETWSASDGAYRFDDLHLGRAYQIIAMDYEQEYNAVIADNVTPVASRPEWPEAPQETLLAPINLTARFDGDTAASILSWRNLNHSQEAVRIYRSATAIDPANLPAPLVELGTFATSYSDSAVTEGETWHYAASAVRSAEEAVGDSLEITLNPVPARDTVTVTLVVADTGHGATTNTHQALINAGFLDANITVVPDSGTIPANDIIVVCRALEAQADVDKVKAHWDAGTPVVWGSVSGGQAGTGTPMPSTLVDLTGTYTITSSTAGYNGGEVVTDSHYITAPFGLGQVEWFTDENWGYSLDTGAAYVGIRLANSDPDLTALAGNASLIAIEAGTDDLLGNPTPTRSVVWANIYGGQSAYTTSGAELLARCIDWCLT